MSRTIMVVLALAFVAGCGEGDDTGSEGGLKPAALQVSTEFVEFGQLPQGDSITRSFTVFNAGEVTLGISDVHVASSVNTERGDPDTYRWTVGDPVGGHAPAGTVRWADDAESRGDVRTNDTSDTEDTTETEDTGFDTGDTEDTGPGEDNGMLLTLFPGARAPITVSFSPTRADDNWDALIITSGDEETTETYANQDKIYRDADNEWKMVYLHGMGAQTAANLIVSPKTENFGFVWPGEIVSRYIALRNVGEGNLTLGSIELSEDCSAGFSIAYQPDVGQVIEGSTSSVIEVQYELAEGADIDEARCKLRVKSDDVDSPEQEVSLVANAGKNANNHAPSVVIISPLPGYQHSGTGEDRPVRMELSVQDPDQPADTLICRVKSAFLVANIASCNPTDPSGHVFVDVPVVDLENGVDVFTVTVTDQSEVSVKASIPILINAAYPEDDDDGDGFGVSGDNPDCDDNNIATYPDAAEIYDGLDNDCDFQVDEETFGFDDDGDGVSEYEGDCNDNNDNTYEGAPEIQDSADNDCDHVIDEGTSAYDDDGDGFTELDLDCNDRDVAINPSVVEICQDGRDNNCNGLKDSQEPCVSVDSAPRIIGGVNLNANTAIEVSESVQVSALVFEADGDELTYKWDITGENGTLDDPTGPSVTYTAPDQVHSDGDKFRISLIVADDDGNQTWEFGEISVYPQGKLRKNVFPGTATAASE